VVLLDRGDLRSLVQNCLRVLAASANQTATQTQETGGDERAACRLRRGGRLALGALKAADDRDATVGARDPQRTAIEVVRVLDMNGTLRTRASSAREIERDAAYGREAAVDAVGRRRAQNGVESACIAAVRVADREGTRTRSHLRVGQAGIAADSEGREYAGAALIRHLRRGRREGEVEAEHEAA